MSKSESISNKVTSAGGGMRLVINGTLSHIARRLIRTHELSSATSMGMSSAEGGVGVKPRESYLGRYYDTDLSLGVGEEADDIVITSAVCSVSLMKSVVMTALAGRDGTVKELISANDYEINVVFHVMSDTDEYPEEGMRRLQALVRENCSLYVDSAFLRLFDIDRVAVLSMEVEQATWGNAQEVSMRLVSDDDYEVEVMQTI